MEVIDRTYAVGRGWSELWSRTDTWLDGMVFAPEGIVSVYSTREATPRYRLSQMRMVHRGKVHSRTFAGREYTKRGLVRVAKRFAREVAEAKTA